MSASESKMPTNAPTMGGGAFDFLNTGGRRKRRGSRKGGRSRRRKSRRGKSRRRN